jgi:hypothetical protein
VDVNPDSIGQSIECPHCQQPFMATNDPLQTIVDDTEPEPEDEPVESDAELDENRIKQVSALRRSLYRGRSYCIVGVIACVVTAIQLVINTVLKAREEGFGSKPIGYVICTIVLLIAASFLLRKAQAIQTELTNLHHPEQPAGDPDFSTLSDGSQRWKNLEDMTRQ